MACNQTDQLDPGHLRKYQEHRQAELVGVRSGLGDRIQQLRYISDYEAMIINMIIIGVLGWMMVFLLNQIEKQVITWKNIEAQ